jgi:hypothetical protein
MRSLLPTGYMVASMSGQLRLVVCDGGLTGWSTHAATEHDQHDHGKLPSAGEHCPFAHAPFSAPLPRMLAIASAAAPESRFLSRSFEQVPPATGPPRQTSARAPPDFQRSTPV